MQLKTEVYIYNICPFSILSDNSTSSFISGFLCSNFANFGFFLQTRYLTYISFAPFYPIILYAP